MSKEFVEGTAIKITTILSSAIVSASIKITNPNNVIVVDGEAMTKLADRTYYYVYQTVLGGVEGNYEVAVTAVSNEGSSIKLKQFCLTGQRLDG